MRNSPSNEEHNKDQTNTIIIHHNTIIHKYLQQQQLYKRHSMHRHLLLLFELMWTTRTNETEKYRLSQDTYYIHLLTHLPCFLSSILFLCFTTLHFLLFLSFFSKFHTVVSDQPFKLCTSSFK